MLKRINFADSLMDDNLTQNIAFEPVFSRGCCQVQGRNDDVKFRPSCAKLDTFDWLKNTPLPDTQSRFDCIEVRFKNNRKDFFRCPPGILLHTGDIVAVEASPGHDIGVVTLTGEIVRLQMKRKNVSPAKEDLRKVYRKVRPADIEKWMSAVSRENNAIVKCRIFAADLGLKMKVNDVEFQGDETKAIFYYTADERVDFRELIKILAEEFKVRIEMKQIGVRQEASKLGGLGSCGRELCCSTWLTGFHSVSTAAARVQQMSLNPQKLAGQCSKLKCCLNYEFESYQDAIKDFPDDNIVLKTVKGEAIIQKLDVFAGIIWFSYKSNDGELFAIPLDKVKEIIKMNKNGKSPDKLEDFARKQEKKVVEMVSANDDLHRFDKK
jgi:cell fate regulator YaaT (PSP1 superfamily)